MGRAHYRPDGTRRRTRGELEARAKKKAQRAQEEAQAAAAAPLAEAEHGAGANGVQPEEPARAEEEMVEIEVEVAEEAEASPVRHRPRVRLRPAPKWGAVRPESPEDMDDRAGSRARARPRERRHDSRSRSPRCTELSAERLFTLSKALTRLLRHKAEAEGLHLRPDGYFCLDALVQTREMRLLRAQPAELIQVVRQDEKQRYTLRHFDGAPYLRAAQGHSQYVSKEHLMQRMRRRDLPPYLYHGTRAWNYESIARRGLLAGGPSGCRTDIHLVEHLPNSGQKVLSGWRSNCELAIQVAPQAATSGGLRLELSCGTLSFPPRTTAPLGAVRSYMSHTPNSESSILWSPGDDSEDFPPSPAPAAPAARDVPAREPPAVGTPVGSLLGRVLRREHYAPEILERALDPNRSDTSTRRDDSGDADTVTATSRPSQAAWADNEVFHFAGTPFVSHARPDGSRRRTAGELAKRAARAAARAAAGPAGGAAAGPAAIAEDDTEDQAVAVSAAPTAEPSASASASTSFSTAAPASAAKPGLAPGAYPGRMQHPPPSIAAGPKPGGGGQRTALKMKAPPPNLLQVTALEDMLGDIQDAEVSTMLNLFQLAGHYTSQHGPFHDLRDALQRDQVCGPNGEPLPLPPVGNWILTLGVSLLGLDSPAGQELFSRIANHQTAGDLVEAWSLQLWERGYRSLCEQLSGYFLLLHNVLADIPPRFYSALGQEWRITWFEFKNVMRAWLGDPPAPTLLAIAQVPEAGAEQSHPGRLSKTLRARSLSPRDGPLLGSRTDLIDGAIDARVFPTILLPYTFPAFQVGSALPLPLQDQSECAYMVARPSNIAQRCAALCSQWEAWLEVQIWLHEQDEHDVVLLQETHWKFTSSWNVLLVGGDFNSMGTRDSMPFGPGVLVRIPFFIFCAGAEALVTTPYRYQLAQPPERVQAFCDCLASTLPAPNDPSDLDRALQQAAAEHLLPVQPRAHGDSAADRVTGMVK
ncbi:TRPT1 [Symbiodinium microadriaticum]|nr:TRPT1 [Symbiodinium microadriaticum]CAE7258363.1 TRPT1 [Symbiodinium sp. KB8]